MVRGRGIRDEGSRGQARVRVRASFSPAALKGLAGGGRKCFCVTGALPPLPQLILPLSLGVGAVVSVVDRWGHHGQQSWSGLPTATRLIGRSQDQHSVLSLLWVL